MTCPYKRHISIVALLLAMWATVIFVGCSSDDAVNPQEEEPALTFEVDPDLVPPTTSLPGFQNGETRPVGCIVNSDGLQAEFVLNELWITSDNQPELDALIATLSAEVISEIETTDPDLSSLPKQTLLRFDPSVIDAANLVETLESISHDGGGLHRVSSAGCLGLFAAASEAYLGGVDAGVNWIGRGQSISGREAMEAPTDVAGSSDYNRNAFQWTTHSSGSVQDIGVAEAWRGLELAGKTDNKVGIAILDLGFEVNNDTPDGWVAISNVPGVSALNSENFIGCGGGSACNWHGTNVLSAAMAVPDDQFGNAGPAGQIAKPIIVFTSYDFFTSISALLEARALGARIANMSYSTPVPTALAWSVYPFEAATSLLDDSGMLLFAAAGNSNDNVDDESCFLGFCYENTWHTPCENAGVICVGGLGDDRVTRAGSSNYGSEHVDIFAPYTMYVGPDPDNPGNLVRTAHGTSLSSPFAAGVAGMIWAANPNLNSDEVRSILYNTAHSSPDETVNRYVNALGAVQAAFGNVPPTIDVFGNTVVTRQLNHELMFSASSSDFEDGNNCCEITWESNQDGDLGTGNSITHTFTTVGSRTITLRTEDSLGAAGEATIALTIVNSPPNAIITKPSPGEIIFGSVPYVLKGHGTDTNEPDQDIACSSLVWTSSDPSDNLPATGCETSVTFGSVGERTITLTATDPQGLTGVATATVSIVSPPDNLPPAVTIASPQNGIDVDLFTEITLSGSAVDPEGDTPITYEWSVNDGSGNIVIGNTPAVQWTPEDTIDVECDTTWDIRITLKATDSFGNSSSDFVDVRSILICKKDS